MSVIHAVIFLLFLSIAIASFVFWLWALIDCVKNEPSQGNDRVVWLLIIIFLHLLGAILYAVIRRPERISQLGK